MNPARVMFVFWLLVLFGGLAYLLTVGTLRR